jgi:heme A synthase
MDERYGRRDEMRLLLTIVALLITAVVALGAMVLAAAAAPVVTVPPPQPTRAPAVVYGPTVAVTNDDRLYGTATSTATVWSGTAGSGGTGVTFVVVVPRSTDCRDETSAAPNGDNRWSATSAAC